jgi:hypothetical protein
VKMMVSGGALTALPRHARASARMLAASCAILYGDEGLA